MQLKTIQVELQGVAKLCICAALTKLKKVTISCFGRDHSVLQWLPFSRGEISMCNIIGDELLLNFGAKAIICNYKIAMASFRTSQCQDDDEVLKCHE